MRRRQYDSEAIARVSAAEIAEELGISLSYTRRLLRKHGWWIKDGARMVGRGRVTYSASTIEKLRGLLNQEHRQVQAPESDWLSRYLGGKDG